MFVTNSLNYLPFVDQIVILDNGRIAEIGKYEDLMSEKEGKLWNFIYSYKTEKGIKFKSSTTSGLI